MYWSLPRGGSWRSSAASGSEPDRALFPATQCVRGSAPIARAPAGLEHAGDLGEHGWLVCAQVDDPVADDHVDRAGLHRHVLDVALFEAHAWKALICCEPAGLCELLSGHI